MMEWWARGNVPTLQQVVDVMKEVMTLINTSSNDDIQSLNLVGVPWKRENSLNLPPRICITTSGVPKWKYANSGDLMEDDAEPSLSVVGSRGARSIEEDDGVDCPSAMAAFVKGSLSVGEQLYDECLQVVEQKRRIDEQWRTKTAKVVID